MFEDIDPASVFYGFCVGFAVATLIWAHITKKWKQANNSLLEANDALRKYIDILREFHKRDKT